MLLTVLLMQYNPTTIISFTDTAAESVRLQTVKMEANINKS